MKEKSDNRLTVLRWVISSYVMTLVMGVVNGLED